MAADPRLVTRIRNRIVGEIHLGHLRPGDRLPSVRELSAELGADHRAVAAAYRALGEEGLVDVRGRAGAFAAAQERLGGDLMGETASWLAGVLAEARRRRVGIPDFPDFVRGCTTRLRPRAACIESNQDSGAAICMELGDELAMDPVSVPADALPPLPRGKRPSPAALPEALRTAHLVVSTAFHAGPARAAADALGKPFVLVTVHPEMSGIIERRLREGPLTVIVADESYGERFREIYGKGPGGPRAIRIVAAGDRAAIARLPRSEAVLATRAARRLLPDLDLPLLLPRYPSISPESSRELAEVLIRLNLEGEQA